MVLYRSDKYYHLANEVTSELKKVTWPTAKEVRSATIVVIVMAVISAINGPVRLLCGRTSRSWFMKDNASPEPNETEASAEQKSGSSSSGSG